LYDKIRLNKAERSEEVSEVRETIVSELLYISKEMSTLNLLRLLDCAKALHKKDITDFKKA